MQNSDDLAFSPSFNCYSTNNATSVAAAKVSREVNEQHIAELHEFSDIEEEDFEFSLEFSGENFSTKDLASQGRILLPIFNTDLVTKDEIDYADVIPLHNLLPRDVSDETQSYSSSDQVDLEDTSSETGTFCVTWRKPGHRTPGSGSDHIKKSRSTVSEESESRRWKIKDILRRSNSLGKETIYFLCPKRVESLCKNWSIVKSVEAPKSVGKAKTASSASIHELFYVQKRAQQKGGKVKSYLPYRKDILGFKVHVNGDSNKKLPF